MVDKSQHRTIRIRTETYRRLKVLAARLGVSMIALLERWVTEAERAHTGAATGAAAPSDPRAPQQDAAE